MSCKTWERQKEGADMRLEETKGDLHLCLFTTFFVNALACAVVTEQVPINTNLSGQAASPLAPVFACDGRQLL